MVKLHPSIKKALRITGRTIFGFLAFIILYLCSAFCLSRITVNKEANTKEDLAIYILTNGVHTDIVMPTKTAIIDWTKEVKPINTISKDSTRSYIAMGWGDKGFYLQTPTWADLKFSVAFKADRWAKP